MWYSIENSDKISTPALAVYVDRMRRNIQRMLEMVGGQSWRLCPHVKTHKMADATRLYLSHGIDQFKCATLAELEMVASCGAKLAVLAYQPVGPHVLEFISIVLRYPEIEFAVVVDNVLVLEQVGHAAAEAQVTVTVMLDLDVGMGRTGIVPGANAHRLYQQISQFPCLRPGGLHIYDGHIHDLDIEGRRLHVEECIAPALQLQAELAADGMVIPRLIAGGTPSFPIHAGVTDRICSPGTTILWDFGYADAYPDLTFEPAAVLLTRVITVLSDGRVCLDLGYKAVASEMSPPRVRLLDFPLAKEVMQSEEHLVIESPHHGLAVGNLVYALPKHICPTVALHEEVLVVDDQRVTERWPVTARHRRQVLPTST